MEAAGDAGKLKHSRRLLQGRVIPRALFRARPRHAKQHELARVIPGGVKSHHGSKANSAPGARSNGESTRFLDSVVSLLRACAIVAGLRIDNAGQTRVLVLIYVGCPH